MYDGVSKELHDAIFLASKQLFALPTEVKCLNTSDTPFHGYASYGGQRPTSPLYETFGIENATTTEGVERFTKTMWPYGNDTFSKSVLIYTKALAELDQIVMRMVAKSYGTEEHYELLLGSTTYLLKPIKYQSPQENERNVGVFPHTHKSFMSIVHQDEVKGLEIRTKDEKWIEVDPSPSSFIVMAGDVCMAWTNGRIEPACHKAMIQRNKERFVLGLYTFIRDLKIQTPQELVDENHPLRFEAFDHYKFLQYHATEEGMRSKCPIKNYCGI